MSSRPYSLFIKAEGAKCNLDCQYCYYLSHEDKSSPNMEDSAVEHYVKNHIDSQPKDAPVVEFIWHGGEPMLRGLDFYQRAVTAQKRHKKNQQIRNTLQTNGTLINERWAAFFKKEQFLIGISIDGPQLLNDIARIDKNGHSSFERTMRGLHHLQTIEAPFNTLTVINNRSYHSGKIIYQFLVDSGSDYLQFQPCIDHELDRRSEHDWSLNGSQWGQFLCDVFDIWCEQGIGKIYVQFFENCLMILMGQQSQMCHHAAHCGQQLMMEANGDVFSCDHYGYEQYRLGNANHSSFAELVNSKTQITFGEDKFDTLSTQCLQCDFLQLCNGGCPKNRFDTAADGKPHNVLCGGYMQFFHYALPRLLKMTDAMQAGHSPSFWKLF